MIILLALAENDSKIGAVIDLRSKYMRLKFPEKVDNTLRYLKYKLLPKTFVFPYDVVDFLFRLIVVQVVSIVAFFWRNFGGGSAKRLSNNLTSDMAFVMQLIEQSPDKLQEN